MTQHQNKNREQTINNREHWTKHQNKNTNNIQGRRTSPTIKTQ
jgi:hypothetical protein